MTLEISHILILLSHVLPVRHHIKMTYFGSKITWNFYPWLSVITAHPTLHVHGLNWYAPWPRSWQRFSRRCKEIWTRMELSAPTSARRLHLHRCCSRSLTCRIAKQAILLYYKVPFAQYLLYIIYQLTHGISFFRCHHLKAGCYYGQMYGFRHVSSY